jgi:NAD(P)-dependent dehydrogenase (short-subunit alcohol dehydrogenase family)
VHLTDPSKGETVTSTVGRLENRTAVVTGGTEGLGRAIVELFLREGARVVTSGRSPEKGARLLDDVAAGDALRFVPGDSRRRDDAERVVDHCVDAWGSVDILVNNVGGGAGFGRVHELSDEAWTFAIELNLNSAFFATRRALPSMLERRRGRIVNMSSVEGKQPTMAAIAHYVTAKHALHGFTKAVALEYGRSGITCNAICPGSVPTKSRPTGEAAAQAAGITYEEFVNHFVDATKTGELNTAEQVAEVALLLAGDLGAGITGVLWSVDGGTANW